MAKEKVILDVDTGSDDAVALIMAMLHPDIEVLGICSVNGNIEVKLTTDNSLRVLELCGMQDKIKVYRGADLPMVSTITPWTPQSTGIRTPAQKGMPNPHREGQATWSNGVHAEHLPLPEPKTPAADISAVEFYLETLRDAEEKSITLVPVGPLTNLALAFRADPTIVKAIKKIVIMGGGHLMNNSSPASEFNIWVDPESAEVVMQSGCEITWVPLDATHAAYIKVEEAEALKKIGTKIADFVGDLIITRYNGYSVFDAETKTKGGVPVHDALAVCAIVYPEVLKDVLHTNVHVDTGSSYGYGETIVERRIRVNEETKNAYFALNADRELFYKFIRETLEYNKNNQ